MLGLARLTTRSATRTATRTTAHIAGRSRSMSESCANDSRSGHRLPPYSKFKALYSQKLRGRLSPHEIEHTWRVIDRHLTTDIVGTTMNTNFMFEKVSLKADTEFLEYVRRRSWDRRIAIRQTLESICQPGPTPLPAQDPAPLPAPLPAPKIDIQSLSPSVETRDA